MIRMNAQKIQAARRTLRAAEDTLLKDLQSGGLVTPVVVDGKTMYAFRIAGTNIVASRQQAVRYFVDGKL